MTKLRSRAPQEANVILGEREGRQRDARAPALSILVLYLAVSLLPAIGAAARGDNPVIAVAHATSLVFVAWLARSRRAGAMTGFAAVARDWLPLLAVPFLYAEVPYLIGGAGSAFRDVAVQHWESGLFGQSPAQTLASALPIRVVSEVLHAGYLSYYLLIYAPPLLLYMRGRRDDFRDVTAAITAVFALCFAIFIVFPVAGPRYLWPAPPGVPDGPVRALALTLLNAGSARGTAFPSSHVAVAVAQTVMALATQRRVGVWVGVLTALLAIGAVYGGFHYAVDVVAGAVVGACIAGAALYRNAAPQVSSLQPMSS